MLRINKLKPILADGIRTSLIMGAGDVLAQTVAEKKSLKDVDTIRTAKFAGLGLVFVGPVLRYWYGTMEKLISQKQTPLKRALKKMTMDQFGFAPCFTLAFTCIVGKMNGDNTEQIRKRVETDYLNILQRNYMIWPAAQIINFSLMPMEYQVTFVQIVAIFWNYYLSTVLNKDQNVE